MTRFIHNGDAIDHTPQADVPAGAVVVQDSLVGIAMREIPANTLGALRVTGVHEFAKAAGSAINVGSVVYWDAANARATGTATGNALLGKAVRTAAAADTLVWVRLDA
jgi:predicted RecA/RadA family phage recombinase